KVLFEPLVYLSELDEKDEKALVLSGVVDRYENSNALQLLLPQLYEFFTIFIITKQIPPIDPF
ncbi:6746_t:CDS:2, partial [Acaulospora morrowiae]